MIQIRSSGTAIITDDTDTDEVLSVLCNVDGTMDVFYYDGDDVGNVDRLGVTDVEIVCYTL